MKQTLKTLIRNVKSINGNSLAEFATVTALMATLAATAAPKLSEMSEGAKAQKSTDELDKLVKQAGQFYQDTADNEGRGRFPGQDKYDMQVGGHASESIITAQIVGVEAAPASGGNPAVTAADPTYTHYQHANGSDWVSVFGRANSDIPKPSEATMAADDVAGTCATCPGVGTNNSIHGVGVAKTGHQEWLLLFGDAPLGSTYQDGHFVYQVVAGTGTGNSVQPPTLYVADVENASHFNNVLEP